MQKFIQKQQKKRNKIESEKPLELLKNRLENNTIISAEILSSSLKEDKIGTIKEILFFRKYDQFKKEIQKQISREEITMHHQLGPIIDQYLGLDQQVSSPIQKQNNSDKKSKHQKYPKEQIKKLLLILTGLIIFVIGVSRRKQLKLLLHKILL